MINNIVDTAKNLESLSGTVTDNKDPSALGALFSIIEPNNVNIANKEALPKEFIFELEEKKIVDYISNIIPNFENKKINLSDISKIDKALQLDKNLNPSEKIQILNFAKIGFNKGSIKNLILSNQKGFQSLNIKDPSQTNNKTDLNMNIKTDVKIDIKTDVKTDINTDVKLDVKADIKLKAQPNLPIDNISKVQIGVDGNKKLLKDNKSDLSSDKSSKNDDFNFVKKIKKNNHPNKLYQMDSTIKNKFSIIKENLVQIDNKNTNIINNNNNLTPFISSDINDNLRSNKLFDKRINSPGVNVNAHPISSNNNSHNQFSQNNSSEFLNNGYNSVLENLLDHLDLTQKGWTSKLVSRIQNALINGGEKIEFNLKPKNLGVLKISLTLKQGIGQVKIITENSFTTNALQQNEALLQKLFNDQGINLDFTAHNGSQNSGSKNNSDHNGENSKDNKRNDSHLTEAGLENNGDEEINNSSRHIVNVIA